MKYTKEELLQIIGYDKERGVLLKINKRKPRDQWRDRGSVTSNGYVVTTVEGKYYLVHRLIWFIEKGYMPPKGYEIDHIDRDKTNNHISNLRCVNRTQNNLNCGVSKTNTLGVKNVTKLPSGSFRASVGYNRKSIHLGTYDNIEDCLHAVQRWQLKVQVYE